MLSHARLEILTTVKFQVWSSGLLHGGTCCIHLQDELPENTDSTVLRNVGILLHRNTAPQPEDGGSTLVSYDINTRRHNLKMEAARSSETLVSCHITTQ